MTRWFEAPLTTLAFCWRLDRRDGVTLGLTSHDRDLMLAGLHYRATPGMVPSAIERSTGLALDSVQLSGALSSDCIRADDLEAGRWDGAQLRLWAVDWTAPDRDPILLVRGTLGAVDRVDAQFSVELLGPSLALNQPFSETLSPHCRAQLGDARCRVDMAGRTVHAMAIRLTGNRVGVDDVLGADAFAFGWLRWTEGPRAGLRHMILSHTGTELVLVDAPDMPLTTPLRIELTEGCDRRLATCQSRFGNVLNFRGEPHLPGNDLLMRYGG